MRKNSRATVKKEEAQKPSQPIGELSIVEQEDRYAIFEGSTMILGFSTSKAQNSCSIYTQNVKEPFERAKESVFLINRFIKDNIFFTQCLYSDDTVLSLAAKLWQNHIKKSIVV
jgi:hypothetical protein